VCVCIGVWGLLDENAPESGVKLTYSAGTQCDGRTGRCITKLTLSLVCAPPSLLPPPCIRQHTAAYVSIRYVQGERGAHILRTWGERIYCALSRLVVELN